jgi:hypothetical protein
MQIPRYQPRVAPQNTSYGTSELSNQLTFTLISVCISSLVYAFSSPISFIIMQMLYGLCDFTFALFQKVKIKITNVKSEIIIPCEIIEDSKGVYSMVCDEYNAIMDLINQKGLNLTSIRLKSKYIVDTTITIVKPNDNINSLQSDSFIANQTNSTIKLDKNIYVAFYNYLDRNARNNTHHSSSTGESKEKTKYGIILTSNKYTLPELAVYLKSITDAYLEKIKLFDDGKLYHITKKASVTLFQNSPFILKV